MSLEDLKTQRDLQYSKIIKLTDKMKTAVVDKSARILSRAVPELEELVDKFEKIHTALLVKAKVGMDDPLYKEMFDAVEEVAGDTKDAVLDCLERLKESEMELLGAQEKIKEAQQKKKKYEILNRTFLEEWENMKTMMGDDVRRLCGDGTDVWKPDSAALAAHILYYEDRYQKNEEMFQDFCKNSGSTTSIEAANTARFTFEAIYRENLLKIRSSAVSTGNSRSSSRRESPERESNAFRSKKLEFPKFNGSIRQYNTFKRDFQEIVEKPGNFSKEQMSHILRNESLQNEAKSHCHNIYDLKELWERLDDLYNDKGQVVELITKQLTGFGKIRDEEYSKLIELINVVEKAHLDLSALGSTNVMSNPMTVRLIEAKCPDWVQKSYASFKDDDIEEDREFEVLLNFLIRKRKEARRLFRLQDEKKPISTVPSKYPEKKKGQVNVANSGHGNSRGGGNSSGNSSGNNTSAWVCPVAECKYKNKHFLSECRAFKRLDADGKGKVVLERKLCIVCFSPAHDEPNCPRKTTWLPCDKQNCGKWHSRYIHGANVPGLVLAVPEYAVQGKEAEKVVFLTQFIELPGGKLCHTFWDHGSSTALITFKFAEKAGLPGQRCSFKLVGVGEKEENYETKLYHVPLVDRSGEVHDVFAFGIEKITAEMKGYNLEEILTFFPDHRCYLEPTEGEVDLLVGISYMNILPSQTMVVGSLGLYNSRFGTGFLIGGSVVASSGKFNLCSITREAQIVARTEAREVKLLDFISAEAFGVDVPRRCRSCRGCKECNFKTTQLTWTEGQELMEIEKGLTLDTVEKKWTAAYPYKVDPSVLKDNYGQAYACLVKTEKRLIKSGQLDAFNAQFEDTVSRGVFRKLVEEEKKSYAGPVNYITIVEAFKSDPHATTPLRLCMNSSMKFAGYSLNDILMKGPSALNDLFSVSMGFRKFKVGFVKDLSKFYQSVAASERDQHLRRVIWRGGDAKDDPAVYVTTTVNFGDKPAGCVAQVAVRETADLYQHIDPVAAELIKNNTYCDDTLGGGDDKDGALMISNNMNNIVSMGGFKYKNTIMSGDVQEDGKPRKVLGLNWDTGADTLAIDVKVNLSGKKKGLRELPDVALDEVADMMPKEITKRVVWRIVLGQFDLLGLTSVFMIRLKLIMRDLSGESGRKLEWDQPIPSEIRERFVSVLSMLKELRKISFPRCIKPDKTLDEEPELLMFGDGSKSAFCTLAYARWAVPGGFECRLISGKTRVAPLRKISIPRIELLGAVACVRLAEKITENLGIKFCRRYFFTDSSAVLGMIRGESAAFQEFTGTRVSEIKTKSDVEKEWFWIPGTENISDLGTRDTVEPRDLESGTDYQLGRSWMRADKESWPATQTPGQVPPEELVKSHTSLVVHEEEQLINLEKYSSFDKVSRILSYVFMFIEALKTKKRSAGKVVILKYERKGKERFWMDEVKQKYESPPVVFVPGEISYAENVLVEKSQKKLMKLFKEGKLDSLLPQLLKVEKRFGGSMDLLVTSGRLGKRLSVGYDKDELPILSYGDHLSKLIMKQFHEVDHAGEDRTVQRSRSFAWIIRGRCLARKVVKDCFKCRLRNRVFQRQVMAPLHESRLPPAPVFHSTAVDLFGPIRIKDTVKGRVHKDCYGVLFCCTVTSAIHLEVAEDYSCDSFLLCLRRFINIRGTPARIQSDPGTQLMAAAKITTTWDYSKIYEWASGKGIDWHKIPTDSQHFNGCAESMIRITKRQLWDTLRTRTYTKGELDTVFSDVMFIVNSRPLMITAGSDPLSGGPITPLHLMGGRSTNQIPTMRFDEKPSLTKRARFLEETCQEFWSKWYAQVFPNLVPSYKWRKEYRDVKAGDVVLLRDCNPLDRSYRLMKVKEVYPGEDGRVRRVLLQYKNIPDSSVDVSKLKFKETERSIHNIAVIVPVDWKPEDIEIAVTSGIAYKCSF